jgi:predicted amidohydrolase YtcJ
MTLSLLAVLALAVPQDLELKNGHVYTGTGVEWEGPVVVADGRIAKPGTKAPEGARSIDLQGAFLYPGLQDAHGHILGLGTALDELDVSGCKDYDALITRVAAAAAKAKKGEWILGRGWDQNLWPDKAMPHHAELSAATLENPVWLVRVDGHAGLANLLAMRASGVSRYTETGTGGEMLVGEDTEPTGVFVDKAMGLINPPDSDDATVRRRLLAAQQKILEAGITCVHDAGVSQVVLEQMKLLHMAKKWHLRTYVMLASRENDAIRKGPWQSDDGLITVRAVKAVADGALGSRGAALLAPYTDRPGFKGLMIMPVAELKQLAQLCADSGMQLCVHAIGDAANRAVLDAVAQVKWKTKTDARFRIEHAQVVAEADFSRFQQLGVIPSMQPTHLTSDMPWAPLRLGPERTKGAYAWRSFHALGLPVAFGSDFPVESCDVRKGLYAAVTTRPEKGGEPLRPEQQLDRKAALKGFTQDAAFAMFAEKELGTVEAGKRADFTVFDRDLLTCPERNLLQAAVRLVIVGGKVAFEPAPR